MAFKSSSVKISVIVPAFNEEKLILESLRSIKGAMTVLSSRGWESELIVCNNNSTDRTAELAVSEGATVVFEPINQISRARNTGAASAQGGWFIFVDADSHPSAGLFAEVADCIASGRCLAGGATVRLDTSHFLASIATHVWNGISRLKKWAPGSFIFCDASSFREIGGFNEKLFATEEIDLFMRLHKLARQSGKKIAILHRHPLLTSGRKMGLYSVREHLRFLGRTVLGLGKTLSDPKECHLWYDGRR